MATYIKTLKEDNGDITYPQTKAGAVLLTNGSDLETEMAKYVTAEDIASTSALTPPVQTNMIANGAVTSDKIANGAVTVAKLSQNIITASIGGTSGNDTQIAQNAVFPINSVYGQIGTGFSVSDNCIVIGSGVTKVLVSASVFFTYRSLNYAWFQLEKNGAVVSGTRTITNLSGSSFGTATMSEKLITVASGDKLSLRCLENSTYRQTHSYITVKQVG